jgi:hypothetical protein
MLLDHLSHRQGVESTSWPSFPGGLSSKAITIITIIVGSGLSTSPVQPVESRPWADSTACGLFIFGKAAKWKRLFCLALIFKGKCLISGFELAVE